MSIGSAAARQLFPPKAVRIRSDRGNRRDRSSRHGWAVGRRSIALSGSRARSSRERPARCEAAFVSRPTAEDRPKPDFGERPVVIGQHWTGGGDEEANEGVGFTVSMSVMYEPDATVAKAEPEAASGITLKIFFVGGGFDLADDHGRLSASSRSTAARASK